MRDYKIKLIGDVTKKPVFISKYGFEDPTMEYNPIINLDDDRLRKECLPLPMSHDMKVLYYSLKRALKIIETRDGEEQWLRNYATDLYWNQIRNKWSLRHVYPDNHTVNEVLEETISAAIAKAEGK